MTPRHIAVIDIGKTNVKLALVAADDLSEISVTTRPNTVRPGPPYPHFDVEGHWRFLLDAFARFHAEHRIDAISVATHGASGAMIAMDGGLAAPILDYEHTGPDETASEYERLRPDFEETGSPRLSMGLNLGAQIQWQFARDPGLRARTRAIVTYPQYWGFRLTGVLASDASSLGAHTDLWNPREGRFSSLVGRLRIEDRIAPARPSSDILGPILPEIARRTGLSPEIPVHCGIHDSNASLLPHMLSRKSPFSVVSTGTWVIAMTVGGMSVSLDPARDTLLNVNAFGDPVPSARFMGGREFDAILAGRATEDPEVDDPTMARVARTGPMLMPAVVPESGPFRGRTAGWIGPEPGEASPERAVALGFYLAMMTTECLSLTGHRGDIVIEGPFCRNRAFCTMLSAATGSAVAISTGTTGVGKGAAMLALGPGRRPDGAERGFAAPTTPLEFADYAARWRRAVRTR